MSLLNWLRKCSTYRYIVTLFVSQKTWPSYKTYTGKSSPTTTGNPWATGGLSGRTTSVSQLTTVLTHGTPWDCVEYCDYGRSLRLSSRELGCAVNIAIRDCNDVQSLLESASRAYTNAEQQLHTSCTTTGPR